MKTIFFSAFMALTLVKFDTQDNLYLEAFQFPNCNEWQHQETPAGEPSGKYNLKRESIKGKDGLRFKSTEKVQMIRLNNFPYTYKIKKVSKYEFEITSKKMNAYFDDTDIVELIVKH